MDTSRILIVDDNPEIREIIHILLEGEGYLIEEASDGQRALDQMDIRLVSKSVRTAMHPSCF